ncbi:aldo/keto reductase [Salinirubrum litoreum]|uniref:Aldo/keto reductase n=1 Tax=Salinirubrum litoreum TaxID=1126234 RepID=A0ABD5RA62_9EURY|nr:aldo/keto reductase [Salinirubrum litoreum]
MTNETEDTVSETSADALTPGAIPPVGLGTMGIEDPQAITTALDVGYRHLDTAQIYENEAVVGEGLADSPVPREDVLVATKVWADSLAAADVRESTLASREKLGVETIDLLYVHRPIDTYDPATTLPAFDALREDGVVRGVGVSNFTVAELDEAVSILDSPLVAHQTEYHPLFRRPELLEHAREHGYRLVAYSPLAGGKVFELPEITAVAEKHETTEAAVAVAWLRAKDIAVIPKASSRSHLEANLRAGELALDDEDVARIDAIEREEELFPE